MSNFVHLHCHTEYSLLDGAIRIKDLCSKTKEFGLPAVAITDHGNMHGAVNFYMAAKDFGVQPIVGCEVYVAGDGGVADRTPGAKRHHLVLLAQDMTGYQNLLTLVSRASLEGFHYRPRVDKEWLRAHSQGLIALSACMAGEVPRVLMAQGLDAGIATARQYEAIFPGRFYLELQANGLAEQTRVNELVRSCAEATRLPLVATNDCHYLTPEDVEAHDVLLCIQTGKTVADERRLRFGTNQLYYRPPQEMAAEFADCPEALENTLRIAEACKGLELNLKASHFPVYALPQGMTLEDEFRSMARKGLMERLSRTRYEVDRPAYEARLEYELDIICRMGFPGYFLIVQDFINWAKGQNIPVGPGRGSAAGSLVAWALKITNLDPIPYNLLFERFLNVERVSLPDIDVDFCERRRHEVIRYVSDKYGEQNVAQITTFGTMKAKAAVKDVGRALGLTFAEANRIAKLIPEELKMTIEKALTQEPELQALYDDDEQVQRCLDISKRLEGLSRHCSTHAAGVVISPGPMHQFVPVYRDKKGAVVTQYDMKKVEKVGLVKFDFLGLRTMTVIQDTLDNIARQGVAPPDLDSLLLDDQETYRLFTRGDTDGVFQVESAGMRKYLMMLKPTCFEDLIAMLALYRPGPLGSGMVEEFIKRKHGQVEVSYPHPSLEDVLKPTYGVIVYQEQVMSIAQVIAGYSLGQADLLRRAMGKKNPEEMAKQRVPFLEGAAKTGVEQATAGHIFDLMAQFAEYGFNKSHSAAYALISYHTAYLKTHFKREFMAALMTSELQNQDKILKYVASCKDMDIRVTPPDINASLREFSVQDGAVRFGLGAVKNVGDEAINEILAAREGRATDEGDKGKNPKEAGPYKSLLDLCTRVNLRKVSKRVLESLAKGGAMDGLGVTRAALFAGLDRVVAYAQKRQKDQDSGQVSLLGMLGGSRPATASCPGLGLECPEQTIEEWNDQEKLAYEKEALGFYLSSHPLFALRQLMRRLGLVTLEACQDMPKGAEVRLGLLVTAVKEHLTKRGDKMAFLGVEDLTGLAELTMFADIWRDAKPLVEADKPLLIKARVDEAEEVEASGNGSGADEDEAPARKVKLLAMEVSSLVDAVAGDDDPVPVDMPAPACTRARLTALEAVLAVYPGRAPVEIFVDAGEYSCRLRLGPRYTVAPTPEFWKALDGWRAG